jgi:hypothetical protein
MPPHQPVYYRNKLLPQPPSFESDDDIDVGEGCRSTEFFPWKRDLDGIFSSNKAKPARPQTQYIEWKTAPKRRKPKKELLGSTEAHSNSSVSSDILDGRPKRSVRHSGSPQTSTSLSRKENSPPQYEPKFSEHRYSNIQKFKVLSSYYREKMKAVDRIAISESESADDLVAIKKELADLRKWAKAKKAKGKKKQVQFAHPLISSLKYRPKTRPEEIGDLYFGEEELLNWEEDRETTSPEQVECMITEDEEAPLQLLITEYRSMSISYDQE